MNKKNLPKKAWASSFNLVGLYRKAPILVYGPNEKEYPEYAGKELWNKARNFSVSRLGEHQPLGNLTTFCSENKAEVEAWISGIRTVLRQIGKMA